MITRIEVAGFKSLGSFQLDIRQGLNVVVGPNGSGKTNIVQFFEFLSQLVRGELSEAVGRSGGAGSIFRRAGESDFDNSIKGTVYGCVKIGKEKFLSYCYSFEILFPRTIESLVYRRQSISVLQTRKFADYNDHNNGAHDYRIAVEQDCENISKPKIRVRAVDAKFFPVPVFVDQRVKVKNRLKRLEAALQQYVSPQQNLASMIFRYKYELHQIVRDISSGDTFNIVPSRVKQPDDSAKRPGIERDGAGLAATLYGIKRGNVSVEDRYYRHSEYPYAARVRAGGLTLQSVQRYVSLANESITGIDVISDPFSNQLIVRLTIHNGIYDAVLPLASMSDGTVKWIALTTAILTTKSIFSLEEPENYLHPLMQSQIVKIMRDSLLKQKEFAFTLMTTHSETILNSCEPHEIVITSMQDGSTVARRCANAQELKREIESTGFGLGYYYIAGAISDE